MMHLQKNCPGQLPRAECVKCYAEGVLTFTAVDVVFCV